MEAEQAECGAIAGAAAAAEYEAIKGHMPHCGLCIEKGAFCCALWLEQRGTGRATHGAPPSPPA